MTNRLPSSPFKGLTAFSEDDAPFFFGRESESKIISANLRTRRLTVLYGPSGVGKTSVINAGVLNHFRQLSERHWPMSPVSRPRNREEGRIDLKGQLFAEPGAPSDVVRPPNPVVAIVFSNWIGDPRISLNDAILDGIRKAVPTLVAVGTDENLGALRLTEMLKELTARNDGIELLIILDQFEEYFVHHPTFEGKGRFADEFSRAVVNLELHANFLISIREDWLARLDRFKGRIPNLFENSIRIDHLKREAAREAIERPIEKYNQLISQRGQGTKGGPLKVVIEEEFIASLLDQLVLLDDHCSDLDPERDAVSDTAQPTEQRIQTSRLQLVMEHLWEKVKNGALPTFGAELLRQPDTVKRIFQVHLDESLKDLNRRERTTAADIFRFLITPSNTKFATTVLALARRCTWPPAEIRELLEKLTERKVSVLKRVAPSPGQRNEEPHYEITSDVLADTILGWAYNVHAEQRRKKARRKGRRKWWIALAGLLVVAIGITIALFVRTQQSRLIEAERRLITAQERAKARGLLAAVKKQDEQIPYSKAVLRGHTKKVTSAVFTPDGRVLTASTDGTAILWDLESKDPIRDFTDEKDEKPLIAATMSPDGSTVVTANTDGSVTLWSLSTGDDTQLRGRIGKHITDITFSPTGDLIAGANTSGEVIIWNTASSERVKEIAGNGEAITQLVFSPSGNLLAAASQDHTARVWRRADWGPPIVLNGHTDKLNSLAFSPDERSVATAGRDKTVRLWDLSTGNSRIFTGHSDSINSVSFDASGQNLLTASDDNTARVWDIATGLPVELRGHTDKVLSASFSPNGLQVVTASRDKVARIWSARKGTSLVELHGHDDQITYVSYSKDGKFVLTASDDQTARVWYAPESGKFEIAQPTITATPKFHPGDCPVTISFSVGITALSGSGTVVYRFKGSDGRIWPFREMKFDEPGTQYINWYWRITSDYGGSETIEVIEPKGIKAQNAKFQVRCAKDEAATPTPTPTESPR